MTYEQFAQQSMSILKYSRLVETLEKEWCIAMMSGGNCWGDLATYEHCSDEEPEFTELDVLLTHFYPSLSFLSYRSLSSKISKERNTKQEYYGNSTTYETHSIRLKYVYEFLKDQGAFSV